MTNSTSAWMPFYHGDFLKKTMHLSTEERGAYLMLILHYWQHGKIENNQKTIKNITQISSKKCAKVLSFFEQKDGYLYHDRIDKEKAKATENKEKYSERAKKAASARWDATSIPQALLEQCPPPSPIPKEKKVRVESDKSLSLRESGFETFWTTYPKNNGSKKTAGEKYESAIRAGITSEQLQSGARAYAEYVEREGTERKYIAHAATWLHQKRWDVDYTDDKPSAARTSNGKYDNRDPATRARDIGESIIAKRNAAAAERLRAESKPTDHLALSNICQPENIRREGGNDGISRSNVSVNSGGL